MAGNLSEADPKTHASVSDGRASPEVFVVLILTLSRGITRRCLLTLADCSKVVWVRQRIEKSKLQPLVSFTRLLFMVSLGFPGGSVVKILPADAGGESSVPGSGRSSRKRRWQATPVFLPGKPHEQGSPEGHGARGCRRGEPSLTTKQQQRSVYIFQTEQGDG